MPKIRIEEVFKALPEAADLDKPQAILEQWGTARQLSKACRMSNSSVIKNLAKLAADQRVHIADWVPGGQAPIWVKGPGENAARSARQLDPNRHKERAAVKLSRAKAKYDQAQIGRGRELSCSTIEKVKATGPRSWISALTDLHGDES